jgi:hypothetical protein
MNSFPVYPNDNGTAVLLDNEKNIIDEFAYSTKMHGVFISNPQGVSLERVDYERATDEAGNWQSAAQTAGFATPTYKNSCYSHNVNESDEMIHVSPSTFSPDGDGYDDVLSIIYRLPTADFVISANVYNLRGKFVREICRNTAVGAEGSIVWDGATANNAKAPVGPYIIHINLFAADGKRYEYKKTCVIAGRR